jgi:hypothetical protein
LVWAKEATQKEFLPSSSISSSLSTYARTHAHAHGIYKGSDASLLSLI